MKEGGIIRDGYSEEVDTLRRAKSEGKGLACKAGIRRTGKDRDQKI